MHSFKSGHNKVVHKQECIRSRVVVTKLRTSRSAFVQDWAQQSYAQAGVHSFQIGRNKVAHKQECIRSRVDATKLCKTQECIRLRMVATKLRISRSAFVQEWSHQSCAQAGVHSFKSGRNKVTSYAQAGKHSFKSGRNKVVHKQECNRSRVVITKLRISRSALLQPILVQLKCAQDMHPSGHCSTHQLLKS